MLSQSMVDGLLEWLELPGDTPPRRPGSSGSRPFRLDEKFIRGGKL